MNRNEQIAELKELPHPIVGGITAFDDVCHFCILSPTQGVYVTVGGAFPVSNL